MIAVIDYGLGNIRAFANIFKNLGFPALIARSRADLASARRIILPGVGAFDHAMERFEASGMRETVEELVLAHNRPVLGVCVGMQILADASEEGQRRGLGWIAGTVRKIQFKEADSARILPHMGWNTVRASATSPLFASLGGEAEFYFLHSYYFQSADPASSIATADYASSFTCAVNSRNIFGVQFHPEKSHRNGIQLLKNFAELE
jgi:imidazole glycerol-phosphate synthase subunit HisH